MSEQELVPPQQEHRLLSAVGKWIIDCLLEVGGLRYRVQLDREEGPWWYAANHVGGIGVSTNFIDARCQHFPPFTSMRSWSICSCGRMARLGCWSNVISCFTWLREFCPRSEGFARHWCTYDSRLTTGTYVTWEPAAHVALPKSKSVFL